MHNCVFIQARSSLTLQDCHLSRQLGLSLSACVASRASSRSSKLASICRPQGAGHGICAWLPSLLQLIALPWPCEAAFDLSSTRRQVFDTALGTWPCRSSSSPADRRAQTVPPSTG